MNEPISTDTAVKLGRDSRHYPAPSEQEQLLIAKIDCERSREKPLSELKAARQVAVAVPCPGSP